MVAIVGDGYVAGSGVLQLQLHRPSGSLKPLQTLAVAMPHKHVENDHRTERPWRISLTKSNLGLTFH